MLFSTGWSVYRDRPRYISSLERKGNVIESLIERLVDRVDRSRIADGRDETAAGRVKKLPWQYEGALSQRESRLLYSLIEHLGPNPSRRPSRLRVRLPQA